MIPKKILFCTDLSENSLAAGRCACEYAKAFGAGLAILHVIDPLLRAMALHERKIAIGVRTVVVGQIEEAIAKYANTRLESMTEEFGSMLKEVEAYCRRGIPSEEIARLVDEESIDLIVMGTHERTGLGHMLHRSVAENVLRTAGCSVLIVKSSPRETPGCSEQR